MISPLRITDARGVAGCVSRPRLNPCAVVEGIVTGYQLRLTTLHDRQQAVLIVRIGGLFGPQFGHAPVLPFLPRE
jgi:hypothetical protein